MMADAVPGTDIARVLGVHPHTVEKWRRRFECENPSERLADAPRSGRPPSLSDAVAARVEAEACRPPSEVVVPVAQWSVALLGKHVRSQGIEMSDRSVEAFAALETAALVGDAEAAHVHACLPIAQRLYALLTGLLK